MSILLPLLLLTVPVSATPGDGHERWLPLDDADGARLPAAVRDLPQRVGQAYEALDGSALLIVRHLDASDVVEAFMADEERVAEACGLTPVGEQLIELDAGEAMLFECEAAFAERPGRVAALYAPTPGDGLLSLWLLMPGEPGFEELGATLEPLLSHFASTVEPPHRVQQRVSLLGHHVSFDLGGARGDDPLTLRPVDQAREADLAFQVKELEGHPTFTGDCIRQWEDAERGVTLSFQVIQGDRSLGPKESLLHHVAIELQAHERVSEEEGDYPIELIHLPGARTVVVSDDEIQRHYANNRNAPEGGVILQTLIPRSPFARATRMRWTEGEGDQLEHVVAYYVELRSYPRNRSETITRSSLAILQARARRAEDLAALEQGLQFASEPLEHGPPFSQ